MEINDSTAEDDDIDPSCYVLDIDIQGIEDKIWVRAEYIRMFKFAEKFYAENKSNLALSPCLVITGQPGIGKSLWRWYALRRCCAQKKPVIFYSNDTCWLFVEEGVFKQPTSFQPQCYNTVIWTLVDSVDAPSGPPIGLITHGSQHFVIYTTTPTPSTWEKLHQSMTRVVCVMNPWTRAEIHRAAPIRAPGVSLTAIDDIFYELGPIPRLCFGQESLLIQHRTKLEVALRNLTLSYLENLSTAGAGLELDGVSGTIYMLRRSGVGVDSVEVDVMTISPFVASKVTLRLRALQRHELVRLFKRYNAMPSMSGDVFKAYCHVIFSTRIEFDFVPMVRIGGRPKARERKCTQWFSSHTEFRGSAQSNAPELEVLRASSLANGASLGMYPSRVVDYDSDEVAGGLHIEANFYYIVPLKANQVGIDSFILHKTKLYLFQMTVADSRVIRDGLGPFLNSLRGLPPKSDWRFIFVKPPRTILACLVPPSAELWDLGLYSAEVEVK
ncbi:hypothetical protein JOM56_007042 [Amanita muscaria]